MRNHANTVNRTVEKNGTNNRFPKRRSNQDDVELISLEGYEVVPRAKCVKLPKEAEAQILRVDKKKPKNE